MRYFLGMKVVWNVVVKGWRRTTLQTRMEGELDSYLLNSSFISSTLDGWQQMATEDWVGSNRGATYVRPTLIRSARVTWETLASKDLEDNDKTGFVLFWGPRILDCPWIFPWRFQVFQDLMFSRPDFCRSLRQASLSILSFALFLPPLLPIWRVWQKASLYKEEKRGCNTVHVPVIVGGYTSKLWQQTLKRKNVSYK